ncbi:MAG: hypothetical protein PXX82_02230 [Methanomassiliicoccales archaeon]|nr:hypothetical protein [Methanomassiliicoccales archaeon]
MLRSKHIAGNREGVAGAVATIFILLIVLSFINIYIGAYVPSYMRTQEYNHMQEVYQEFSSFQLQNYVQQSGHWPYPLPTTFVMGSSGEAPFTSPTTGTLSFQPGGFNASISYSVGLPQYLPQCQYDIYNNTSGTVANGIQLSITFIPNTTGNGISLWKGKIHDGGSVWNVSAGSVICLYINGSYVNSDRYNIYLGWGNSSNLRPLNDFNLITYVQGNHDNVRFYGLGNNLTAWYISYGSNNRLGDNSYPCGFNFYGNNDIGYVQNYGANDKAPLGWPHFLSVHQSMALSGLLSLYVQNRYYSQGTVTYEGGSILLNQGGQIAVIKNPQFSLRNSSTGAILSMDMTSLRGTGFSVSGSGSANLLSTYFSNQSQKYLQYRGLNLINNISLSVTSPEISGWLQMLAPYLAHLQNVTSNPSVADIGSGCNLNTYVTWGAYSMTVSGNTLHLTIFNIASLILVTGTMSITD